MALLTEGEKRFSLSAINMTLLTEGQEAKLPSLCGIHTSEAYKSHLDHTPL